MTSTHFRIYPEQLPHIYSPNLHMDIYSPGCSLCKFTYGTLPQRLSGVIMGHCSPYSSPSTCAKTTGYKSPERYWPGSPRLCSCLPARAHVHIHTSHPRVFFMLMAPSPGPRYITQNRVVNTLPYRWPNTHS